MVTLVSATGGAVDVFIARGQTAVVNSGMMLQVGVPQKFYGSLSLNGICATGAATAVVAIQKFSVLEGTRVREIDPDV